MSKKYTLTLKIVVPIEAVDDIHAQQQAHNLMYFTHDNAEPFVQRSLERVLTLDGPPRQTHCPTCGNPENEGQCLQCVKTPNPPPNPCEAFPKCDCGWPYTVLAACDPKVLGDLDGDWGGEVEGCPSYRKPDPENR